MNSKAIGIISIFVLMALLVHGALAIIFAFKGQYAYLVAFIAVFSFVALQLRNALKQLKTVNAKMDAILSKTN